MERTYEVVVLSQSLTRSRVSADSVAWCRRVRATSRRDAINRCMSELMPLLRCARLAHYRYLSVYCAQRHPLRYDPIQLPLTIP